MLSWTEKPVGLDWQNAISNSTLFGQHFKEGEIMMYYSEICPVRQVDNKFGVVKWRSLHHRSPWEYPNDLSISSFQGKDIASIANTRNPTMTENHFQHALSYIGRSEALVCHNALVSCEALVPFDRIFHLESARIFRRLGGWRAGV